MGQLADWKCHKVVKAGRIVAIPALEGADVHPWMVEDVNGAPCGVLMPANAFARGRPSVGDYIVVYEDGYKSWSPAKTFEDGYVKV